MAHFKDYYHLIRKIANLPLLSLLHRPTKAIKDLVTKLVEDIHGVKSVQNKMTIAKEDTATTGERFDDAAVTAKVKMALALHRSTGALRTTVATEDGVVTVSGKALSSAEKELVSKVVEDVSGVKGVVNKMIIEK